MQPKNSRYNKSVVHQLVTALGAVLAVPAGSGAAWSATTSHEPLSSATSAQGVAAPLTFERNIGQVSQNSPFLARVPGYMVFVEADGVSFQRVASGVPFPQGNAAKDTTEFGFRFSGVDASARPLGTRKTGGVSRYYTQQEYQSGGAQVTEHYGAVTAKGIYPGIDVVYYGNERHLEYDLIAEPNADLREINIQLWGADGAWVDGEGHLNFRVGEQIVSQRKPYAYQETDVGVRTVVEVAYVAALNFDNTFSIFLNIGEYDKSQPLVIDPLVISYNFSRLLGGIGADGARAVAVEGQNTYIAGYATAANGNTDAFVTKIGSSGGVIYTTYLGGSGNDAANSIAVDALGKVVVGGVTSSSQLGGSGTFGGGSDGFIAKLSANGAQEFTRLVGGSGADSVRAIALDGAGNIYATGDTASSNFLSCVKTASTCGGPLPRTLVGASDAFIVKLGASGGTQFEAYLGASGMGNALFVDSSGAPWIAGESHNVSASGDAFVVRVDPAGSSLGSFAYLGGSGLDFVSGLAVDNTKVYVAGKTFSRNFPTVNPFQGFTASPGSSMGFVAHLSRATGLPEFSSLVGGSGNSFVSGLQVDAAGNAYVVGVSDSGGLTLKGDTGSYQQAWQGQTDAFMAKIGASGSLDFATYLGGSGADVGAGIALGQDSAFTVVGTTASGSFPVTSGFTQPVNVSESFVTKFTQVQVVPTPASRLINLSTRGQVQTENNVMIGGFVIGGTVAKTVLIRAVGPNLANYGVTGVLANPTLQIFSGSSVIASNDDWGAAANAAAIQSTGLAPVSSLESAVLVTLNPGAYTAVVAGAGGGTGVGIVEVYDIDHPEIPLINISTRGQVMTGNDAMIGGFIIQGTSSQTVLIRAVGPNLANYGVTGVLANPNLQLYSGQTAIASNDNWGSASNAAAIQATGLAPASPLESAILITLPPGAYTAVVTGADGGTGVGIVEVFAQ